MVETALVGKVSDVESANAQASAETELATVRQRLVLVQAAINLVTTV